ATAEDETVELLRAPETRRQQAVAEGNFAPLRVAADGEREPALDEFRDAKDRLGCAVVILHEPLDADQDVGLVVAEVFGDARLEVEIENVGGAGAEEMEFVAHAQEEIVGAVEFGELLRTQVVLRAQFFDTRD